MKSRLILILLGCVFLVGCTDDTGKTGQGSVNPSATPGQPPAPPPLPPAPK
jgi:hypothetical protein